MTFGSGGTGGGIYRPLPVTLPVTFGFDFRSQSPHPPCDGSNRDHAGGGWLIAFNAPGAGYANAQLMFFQYYGSQPILRQYKTSAGVVTTDSVPSTTSDFGPTPVRISGTVKADFSAILSIGGSTYSFPSVANAALTTTGNLVLSNSHCGGGLFFFDNVRLGGSCSVNVSRYAQGGSPWGPQPYASYQFGAVNGNGTPATMKNLGCATTALSMALLSVGIAKIPLAENSRRLAACIPAQGSTIDLGVGRHDGDPGVLNCFMAQRGDYGLDNNVDFVKTTIDVSRAEYFYSGKLTYFDRSESGSSSVSKLKDLVCEGNAVVVGVAPVRQCVPQWSPGARGHFVLVHGASEDATGNHFDIVDPGCSTIRDLEAYHNDFTIRGFVVDPVDVSTLHITTSNNADILLTDALGHRAGSLGRATSYKEVPRSSYAQDFITDTETGLQATGITHSVSIFHPTDGTYSITVTGLELGTYNLVVAPFAADGTRRPEVQIFGIADRGAQTTYRLDFLAESGAGVMTLRTFSGTITDINASLKLGLIHNSGIANSLSKKIEAAQNATGSARNNILNAFKNEVNAQSGKHITGIASQVLLQDADSLISQSQ